MRIKLEGDILEAALRGCSFKTAIANLAKQDFDYNKEFWEGVKSKYPGLNFTGANINHETGELIIPFEDEQKESKV